MEGTTSNPWLSAIINMTIVFGVLITLGIIMKIIKFFDSMIMDRQ